MKSNTVKSSFGILVVDDERSVRESLRKWFIESGYETESAADANEALEIGLVTKVYPINEFKEKSLEFVRKIAEMPTKCLGYNKSMLNFSQFNELFPSLQNEFRLYCKNIRTYDFGEGMKSFMKKREPNFKGR